MSIFSKLPHDIIMDIIKMTDSSICSPEGLKLAKGEHEDEWCGVMDHIERVGDEFVDDDGDPDNSYPAPDQFFCGLYHNDGLTDTISEYRRRLR